MLLLLPLPLVVVAGLWLPKGLLLMVPSRLLCLVVLLMLLTADCAWHVTLERLC